jgi:hypothetical protein
MAPAAAGAVYDVSQATGRAAIYIYSMYALNHGVEEPMAPRGVFPHGCTVGLVVYTLRHACEPYETALGVFLFCSRRTLYAFPWSFSCAVG